MEFILEKPVYKGFNLAYSDKKTSFVQGGIEGEKVKGKSFLEKKNYRFVQVASIIERSPQRIKPRCQSYLQCGGCQYQHIKYQEQIKIKLQIAQEILSPYKIEGIVPSPRPFRYRNKALLPIQKGKIGFYAFNSHQIVTFKDCFLQTKKANLIIKLIKKNLKLGKEFKGIILRTNQLDHLSLTFVVRKVNNFIKTKLKNFFLKHQNLITSLWLSHKEEPGNYLLDGKNIFLAGKKDFFEIINDKKIFIEPTSFLQVNTLITQKIYSQIKNWIKNYHIIIDGYAGCGSIGICCYNEGQKLILAENNPSSSKMLLKNLSENKILNFEYYEKDFEKIIDKIGLSSKKAILILDPPRKGVSQFIREKILELKPQKFIYLSCNPTTLKRDLDFWKEEYHPTKIIIYDMFPQTYHFETLSLIEKKE